MRRMCNRAIDLRESFKIMLQVVILRWLPKRMTSEWRDEMCNVNDRATSWSVHWLADIHDSGQEAVSLLKSPRYHGYHDISRRRRGDVGWGEDCSRRKGRLLQPNTRHHQHHHNPARDIRPSSYQANHLHPLRAHFQSSYLLRKPSRGSPRVMSVDLRARKPTHITPLFLKL